MTDLLWPFSSFAHESTIDPAMNTQHSQYSDNRGTAAEPSHRHSQYSDNRGTAAKKKFQTSTDVFLH